MFNIINPELCGLNVVRCWPNYADRAKHMLTTFKEGANRDLFRVYSEIGMLWE